MVVPAPAGPARRVASRSGESDRASLEGADLLGERASRRRLRAFDRGGRIGDVLAHRRRLHAEAGSSFRLVRAG